MQGACACACACARACACVVTSCQEVATQARARAHARAHAHNMVGDSYPRCPLVQLSLGDDSALYLLPGCGVGLGCGFRVREGNLDGSYYCLLPAGSGRPQHVARGARGGARALERRAHARSGPRLKTGACRRFQRPLRRRSARIPAASTPRPRSHRRTTMRTRRGRASARRRAAPTARGRSHAARAPTSCPRGAPARQRRRAIAAASAQRPRPRRRRPQRTTRSRAAGEPRRGDALACTPRCAAPAPSTTGAPARAPALPRAPSLCAKL